METLPTASDADSGVSARIGDLNIGDMIADRLEQSLVNADLNGSLNSVGNSINSLGEADSQ